jgi:DNA helicase-2/ATP-dependent DNA helicase PcrA
MAQKNKNICAVGDDDQSIYRFRGADVQHILNFEKDFPKTKVVRLERNYRSTQNILDASHSIISMIANRKSKKLWTERGSGEMVNFCWLSSEEEEARHIAKVIKELYLKGSYAYKDVGILYRVNLQSRAIEDALREMGLPYHIVGGVSFYQRKEVKDIIAYVRLVLNHEDNVSLRRIINTPARGIGAATLTKIENEAKKKSICLYDAIKDAIKGNGIIASTREKLSTFINLIDKLSSVRYKSAGDLLKAIADKVDCLGQLDEERRQNVIELMASGEGRDMQDFLDKVSLMSSNEQTSGSNLISLMTLHNAKGLEFPVVFLSGMEEGLLPYFKSIGNPEEVAEERRLCYVGMTRAKDILFLSGARKRKLYSKLQEQEPSRFLKDLPKACCRCIEKISAPQTIKIVCDNRKKYEIKKTHIPFAAGCRVKHPVWGVGVVRDCYGDGEEQKVMVNFPQIGLKRLSLKMANLTKI